MSKEIGTALPYTQELEMPAMALPVGFVLSQQWGSLHVTAAASEAYAMAAPPEAGLAAAAPAAAPSGRQYDPQIDIWLIAPKELSEPVEELEAQPSPLSQRLAPGSEVYLHDKGVGLTAEFGHDKSFMTQLMASFYESKTGHPAEMMFAYRPSAGTEKPLMEDIEQDVPMFFAHLLNEGLREALPPALYARERLVERRQALDLATRAMVLPPLAAGASALAAEILRFGELGLPVAAAAGAAAAARFVRNGIRTYLSLSERMERSMRENSALKAAIVGRQIEEAFALRPAATEAAGSDE